jgi:hypothetical protein
MPGLKPAKRTRDEIAQEIDRLMREHQTNFNEWVAQRFGSQNPDGDHVHAESKLVEAD